MKLWQAMLSGNLEAQAEIFNRSIEIDQKMVFEDIEASIVHVSMLEKTAILTKKDAKLIINGLNQIKTDLLAKKLEIDLTCEDIHTFIENKLIERIGETAKRMHTARSRNDQVVTDLRLYLRKQHNQITDILIKYIQEIISLSKDHVYTIMPGLTHLQAAQPITFGHHMLAYAFMALRDVQRMQDAYKRLNVCPLGACALATTTLDIDRTYTAQKLGFDEVIQNSIDAVSDRDFVLEFHSNLSFIAIHLSRLCEELILWCSQPFSYISLADQYSTGSSIMPQKKNPDMAELIKAKSAKIIGNLNQSLIMVKGVALSYSKDFQEDKQSIFESIDIVKNSLEIITGLLKTMTVKKDEMYLQAQKGFLNATDLADYLVNKQVPFRDAHHISAKIVAQCIAKKITLEQLTIEEYQKESPLFEIDLYEHIKLINCVEKRKVLGGPSSKEVLRQISYIQDAINNMK